MIKVSVIVCTYNRQEYLPSTLKHLREQSHPKDEYEVILVNNNSTDQTHEICERFVEQADDINVHYVIEYNQGHTYARNRGINESTGKYLAFIDDDAFVDKDYVYNITKFFDNNPDVAAIGGRIIPQYESTEPKWMSKYLLPLVAALDMGDKVVEFERKKFPIGANMAYRSEVFEKHGLFDVNLGRRGSGLEGGDEKDMIYRIKKEEKVCYVPQVLVHHIIPEKRLRMDYIKAMAKGVASSEKKRIQKLGSSAKIEKLLEEGIKSAGTLVLALKYASLADFAKSKMLIKFRYWIIKEYLRGHG